MKRQDMIDTMRAMGWRPVGCPYHNKWVGVTKGDRGIYRPRQSNPYFEENYASGCDESRIISYPWGMEGVQGRWSNLCDDEVLRFYLKIMMEGL